MIKGKRLDNFARNYGLKRKRKFLIFKESDECLRKRILSKRNELSRQYHEKIKKESQEEMKFLYERRE